MYPYLYLWQTHPNPYPWLMGTGISGYGYRWLRFYPWVTRVKHYLYLGLETCWSQAPAVGVVPSMPTMLLSVIVIVIHHCLCCHPSFSLSIDIVWFVNILIKTKTQKHLYLGFETNMSWAPAVVPFLLLGQLLSIEVHGWARNACYNFEQLEKLSTVVFHKEVTFRVEFKVRDEESFVYWETKTSDRTRLLYSHLYTRERCSQSVEYIWYVCVNNEEQPWNAYGGQCGNNEE